MARIQQLSDHVANQIAAGEVVERPVAVVKELVENALDAGCTQIEIEFRTGGKRYIRVTDDGCGMDREDAVLSLQRHATSKLRETADLLRIGSFGFRGEALPSIASVSKFTLRTREKAAESGTEIQADGLGPLTVKDAGCPPGTTIEVARLFHSVPARRKFLKTDRTEAAHITQLCRLFAVAHPEIGFALIEDGNLRFRSPPGSDLKQRVREIFGRQLSEDLIPLNDTTVEKESSGGISVSGLIGRPGAGRSTRAELFTFVNRRPVDNRVLSYALIESYHTYIPKGRYPLAFLFVDLPPAAVDVNVHPAKREVRFRDEGLVRQVVMQAILGSLRTTSDQVLKRARPVDRIPSAQAVRPPESPTQAARQKAAELLRARTDQGLKQAPPIHPPVKAEPTETPTAPAPTDPVETRPFSPPPASLDGFRQSASRNEPATTPSTPVRKLDWRYLGLTRDGLALFESTDGFVCLHVAAARRRVFFEKVETALQEEGAPMQTLLFPVNLELDPVGADVLEAHLGFFQGLGFDLELFGRNFFRIRGMPSWFEPEAGTELVRDLIGLIRERGLRPELDALARETVARLATQKMVREEGGLQEKELPLLAEQLLGCRNPLSDPKGRPTFFEVRRSEWRKRFGLDG